MPPSQEAQQRHNQGHAEPAWLCGNAFTRVCTDCFYLALGKLQKKPIPRALLSLMLRWLISPLSSASSSSWHCCAPESCTHTVHDHCSCLEAENIQARSYFFLCELCAGETTPRLSPLSESLPQLGEGRSISGMSPRHCSCCISKQPFLYSLKSLQEPSYEEKMHLEKGSTAG